MSSTPTESRPGLLLSLLQVLFYGGITVAFLGYAYVQFFGNPFQAMAGDNLLEAATRVGVSDKARMDAFKGAGGLDKESSWKEFQVREYEAVYHPDGRLAMVTFALIKSWPRRKLASLDNIQAALTPQCGSSWSRNNLADAYTLKTSDTPKGLICSALDQGQDVVIVNIADAHGRKTAEAAPTQSPSVPAAPDVAPAPAIPENLVEGERVQTVAGELIEVTKPNAVGPSILKLGGRVVFEASDSAVGIKEVHSLSNGTAVLLSLSSGGTACPAMYRVLSISPSGRVFTSDEFGTCSDLFKVAADASSLSISMPNMNGTGESTWTFSGETLTQVGGPR